MTRIGKKRANTCQAKSRTAYRNTHQHLAKTTSQEAMNRDSNTYITRCGESPRVPEQR